MSSDIESAVGGGKPFSIGSVIGETFSLYGGNFLKFTVTGILIYVPVLAIMVATMGMAVVTGSGAFDPNSAIADPGAIGAMMTGLVTSMFFMLLAFSVGSGAITYGAIESKSGNDVGLGAMIGRALVKIIPLVLASIVMTVLIGIGMIFLIIPGIIIALMLIVTWPVILAEGLGPIEALGRSRELTKGHKWGIFGGYLVFYIISMIIQLVLMMVSIALGEIGALIGTLLSYAILLALSSTFFASLYTNLRESKEGVSIEQMAAVFE